MNATEAKRFHKHFHFMCGVPDKGVDMDSWFTDIETGDEVDTPPQNQDARCGTAACVAGWLIVSFPDDWGSVDGHPALLDPQEKVPGCDCSAYSVSVQFSRYFGITFENAQRICGLGGGVIPDRHGVLAKMVNAARNAGWDIEGDEPVMTTPAQ